MLMMLAFTNTECFIEFIEYLTTNTLKANFAHVSKPMPRGHSQCASTRGKITRY